MSSPRVDQVESALAIQEWRRALGDAHVITQSEELARAAQATFRTQQQIPAILRPGSREEVRECLRIANRHRVPVYPVSGGKNWGYGSRVPVTSGCVLMELGRMNRILKLDGRLGTVTVEPGVTFGQLAATLQREAPHLMMAVGGSTDQASPLGNVLERGLAGGPYGDRLGYACDFEVVMASGEVLHTGMERFEGARCSGIYRWGLGPYLDGLFTQSNFGVVTRITIWLMERPRHIQRVFLSLNAEERLDQLVERLRELARQGILRDSITLWNDYKYISALQRYPWDQAGGVTPLPEAVRKSLRHSLGIGAWQGGGAIYSSSPLEGFARRRVAARALKGAVDWLGFATPLSTSLRKPLEPFRRVLGSPDPVLRQVRMFGQSAYTGTAGDAIVASTYWRKKTMPKGPLDPDRDRCGVLWLSPLMPFLGEAVQEVVQLISTEVLRAGLEPNISLFPRFERAMICVVALMYDRDEPGADDRAFECYDRLSDALAKRGYLPYRLGIRSMSHLPAVKDDSGAVLRRIKQAMDPEGILAPGRYEFACDESSAGAQVGEVCNPRSA